MLTRSHCLCLMDERKVPERVQRHCIKVAWVALKIAHALNARGFGLDCQAVESAALLHDIARGSPRHAQEGARFLRAIGQLDLAEIVAQHMTLESQEDGRISETSVVYLADKLVCEDVVVTLEERFSARREDFMGNPGALAAVRQNREAALKVRSLVEQAIGIDVYELISKGACFHEDTVRDSQ